MPRYEIEVSVRNWGWFELEAADREAAVHMAEGFLSGSLGYTIPQVDESCATFEIEDVKEIIEHDCA